MKQDDHFASIYDILMEDAPYDEWVFYTNTHLSVGSTIVDLACGTGTLALLLHQSGYRVSGVDLSQDMLTIAERKVREAKFNIPLFHQDMRELIGFSNVDGVTLFCDGLNYLMEEEDVLQTFKQVASVLKPGGVFLFDIHSVYKMVNIFNDQLYGTNGEDISYLWFSNPGDMGNSVEHSLTFFIKREDGFYERKDEEHEQRTYALEKYTEWLIQAGFENIEITSDFGRDKPVETDERYFFKAIKK